MAVDHLEPSEVEALVGRIDRDSGRLDVLVNDIWGAEKLFEWNVPVWEHDLDKGLHILRLAVETHLVTSRFALLIRRRGGLVVEMTDGTREYNAERYASRPSTTWRRRPSCACMHRSRARASRMQRGRPDAGLAAVGDDA